MKILVLPASMLMMFVACLAGSEELGRAVIEDAIPRAGYLSASERIQMELLWGCVVDPGWGLECLDGCPPWRDTWLTASHAGTTATVSPTTECPMVTEFFTDDVTQECGISVGFEDHKNPGTIGWRAFWTRDENELFGLEGNDFHGATINSFTFRLDSLWFEDGPEPPLKRVHVILTWIVEGTWDDTPVEAATWGRIKALYVD